VNDQFVLGVPNQSEVPNTPEVPFSPSSFFNPPDQDNFYDPYNKPPHGD